MTPSERIIAAVALLVVGLAVLGFTGCGLFFGFTLLLNNGGQISWLGFACAAVGAFVLWPICRSLKEILWQKKLPEAGPAQDVAHGPDDSARR